jgi:hypothetical protein
MRLLRHANYTIVILEKMNDVEEVVEELVPHQFCESDVIYVAMQGYSVFDRISKERFLVKNPENPFDNHLMWEGLFDSEEQEEYIKKCCEKFWNTGKQMLIEDYEYEEDEPFYDYSK